MDTDVTKSVARENDLANKPPQPTANPVSTSDQPVEGQCDERSSVEAAKGTKGDGGPDLIRRYHRQTLNHCCRPDKHRPTIVGKLFS